MEQAITETLFISFEEFKRYTEKEQLEFLKRMKRHRLMRHQAVAWGFGDNYLSQHYFKLRTNMKNKRKKQEAETAAATEPVAKPTLVPKIEKEPENKKEEVKVKEVKKETAPTPKPEEAVIRVSAESIQPEKALSLLTTLREVFADSKMEYQLRDTEEGCNLLFVANHAIEQ